MVNFKMPKYCGQWIYLYIHTTCDYTSFETQHNLAIESSPQHGYWNGPHATPYMVTGFKKAPIGLQVDISKYKDPFIVGLCLKFCMSCLKPG